MGSKTSPWRLRELSVYQDGEKTKLLAGFRSVGAKAECRIELELMGVLMILFDEVERELVKRVTEQVPEWIGLN